MQLSKLLSQNKIYGEWLVLRHLLLNKYQIQFLWVNKKNIHRNQYYNKNIPMLIINPDTKIDCE